MLRNQQKRYLKTLAHSKKAVVMIGNKGLTEAVLNEADRALADHELIKIKINAADRQALASMIEQLCESLDTELVQRIGHTATLFRHNLDKPRIQLP
ncbi:MAG: ribosome assembly RNA-binding protein YhbY [Candidatus Competibacteraceae bacterium]|nr:ribosome assembly RNA-binding protein YhbY [Candidatus Competibacteraceae bacterium]